MPGESAPQGVVAGSIPLFAGHPAPELLPTAALRQVIEGAWAGRATGRFLNYGDERGDPQLLDFLAERVNREESLCLKRENLMLVGGSTWGLNMIAGQLASPGDAILVDAPSYRDALHIFRDQRLDAQAVEIDGDGICVDALERRLGALAARGRAPKFYYVVPNFQNPSGITMTLERRQAVVDLSRRYGFVILEDDVYHDIRFGGELPPSMFALAGGELALRLGSFSKTLAPGLRMGWLMASAERIAGFVDSGLLRMGGGANPFSAAIVADFCRSGAWERHLDWLRGQYQARRDIALAALNAAMPAGVEWTKPEGGYFIWLTLPKGLHVDELEGRARARDVYFASGKGFFVEPAAGARHLRLSFSYLPPENLRQGIACLGELIGQMEAG